MESDMGNMFRKSKEIMSCGDTMDVIIDWSSLIYLAKESNVSICLDFCFLNKLYERNNTLMPNYSDFWTW